jgi:hypothetical protein
MQGTSLLVCAAQGPGNLVLVYAGVWALPGCLGVVLCSCECCLVFHKQAASDLSLVLASVGRLRSVVAHAV